MAQKSFLFVLRHPFFLKNFAAVLNALTARGHKVRVLFSVTKASIVTGGLEEVVGADNPSITFDYHEESHDYWSRLVEHVAFVMDVFRYRDGVYDQAESLRARAVSKGIRGRTRRSLARAVNLVARLFGDARTAAFLRWFIEGLPVTAPVFSRLSTQGFDAVIVSPLTPVGSEQALILQAARRLGIRTVYAMYSWDNLTNKGLIRPRPDAGVVWNDMHIGEAVEMHKMPIDAMTALGSPGYDIWFDQKPTLTREEFASRLSLDPTRRFVLYTCSSVFVGGRNELAFVERLLERLRSHPDPDVAGVGVLVRPHPQNTAQWETADLSRFGNVVISPRAGEIPFSGSAREDYYHAIFFSGCVIGINTSAMVEAAIIDRPVIVISDPSYAARQEGTLHFQHLKHYGFLQQAPSIVAAVEKVAMLLREDSLARADISARNLSFVEGYIRPRGITTSAAPLWAEEFERQAGLAAPSRPLLRGAVQLLLGLALLPAIHVLDHWAGPDDKTAKARAAKAGLKSKWKKKHVRVDDDAAVAAVANTADGKPTSAKAPKAGKLSKPLKSSKLRSAPAEGNDAGGAGGVLGLENGVIGAKEFEQAVLNAPFAPLVGLQKAFHEREAAPDILCLGDSVHYRVSTGDADSRNLPTMLADELSGVLEVHALHYSAFHPVVYDAAVEAAMRMRHPPKTVVMPINLRSFSPQWSKRPEYLYEDVRELFASHIAGEPVPILRRHDDFDLAAYHATPVAYDMSPLDTIAAFAVVATAKKTATSDLDRWRARQLMIYHYTDILTADHGYVLACARLARRMKDAGGRLYSYVTPINMQFGVDLVGAAFERRVKENIAVVREAMLREGDEAVTFVDYSDALGPSDFFHPEEKTEHLNESGRMRLAARVASDLRQLK